ncbi:hypothetical protein V1498_17545 [Peribacillus sp. SCS-26]|uniref:hypothetical protein n=1 Tax=Paraperibacillus marinus TaxID=3115295 RepID=UPI003905900C
MSLTFNPKKFGINEKTRLVIYDSSKQVFYLKIEIKKEEIYTLEDQEVIENSRNYKYKFQLYKNGCWEDVTNYISLLEDFKLNVFKINGPKIEDFQLEDFLLEKSNVDDNTLNKWIKMLVDQPSPPLLSRFRRTITLFMRSLWSKSNSSHKNAKRFIQALKTRIHYEPNLLGNIVFYLENYLEIKQEMTKRGHNTKFYDYQYLINNEENYSYLETFIKKLEKHSSTLQMASVLSGKLYSFLGQREKAIKCFQKALLFSENYIPFLNFDQGLYTYSDILPVKKMNGKIEILFDNKKRNNTVLLISVDQRFLRLYGINLMFMAMVLKKYHFHFHVIGNKNEVEKCVSETISLFNTMKSFRQSESPIIHPTFSMEDIPKGVPEMKTYFACARFLTARYFMDYFNSDLYIMDADLFTNSDPGPFLKSIKNYDVGLAFSRGVVSICPWRRIMAGNVFLKNNHHSRSFISLVEDYIYSNLSKEKTWTLDQNALSYAYEQMAINPSVNIGNIMKVCPFYQPGIRRDIES